MTNDIYYVEILEPTGRPAVRLGSLSPRLASLRGKTVGLLDVGKRNHAPLLERITDLLGQRYGVTVGCYHHKIQGGIPSNSQPAPADMLDELAMKSHFVIVGVGD
jgi:hypothetical protein